MIYGQKYFLTDHREGLAPGWYAGGSSWSCDRFDYSGSTRFAGNSASGFSAPVAGETGYEGRMPINARTDFYCHPAYAFSSDKDYEELHIALVGTRGDLQVVQFTHPGTG